ncbi:MAG: tripartite tricarboxylate transporter TctB family protein [Candidatus Rokubacteria bacterium]|nr:tripartite tricarboxylate transporter TctB family protein [Candidatus Rokubacteria bacterium]
MKRAEVACVLAILIWTGLMLREAMRLNIGWEASGPGAGFFPFWLSTGLALSAAAVLVRALRSPPTERPFFPRGALPSLLKLAVPIAGMILAMQVVGFYLAGALYLGVSMRWLGRHRWPLVVGVSLLFPVAVYFVIERWFLVGLPRGYLDLRPPF